MNKNIKPFVMIALVLVILVSMLPLSTASAALSKAGLEAAFAKQVTRYNAQYSRYSAFYAKWYYYYNVVNHADVWYGEDGKQLGYPFVIYTEVVVGWLYDALDDGYHHDGTDDCEYFVLAHPGFTNNGKVNSGQLSYTIASQTVHDLTVCLNNTSVPFSWAVQYSQMLDQTIAALDAAHPH